MAISKLCRTWAWRSFRANDFLNSIMAQVFVVTAAGSVVAFIARDLGDASLVGWVIQVC
jgi:hypothetical protein